MNSITESENQKCKCDKCKDKGWIPSKAFGIGAKLWCPYCDTVKLECRIDSLGKTYHVRVEPK